jgi:dienelactone hydrolase
MLTDVFWPIGQGSFPVVVYAHGFNGFKDWGNFDLIARQFAEAGIVFVKFNFSHNGTGQLNPTEFVEPELFGRNNYTKELNDLRLVVDWVFSAHNPAMHVVNIHKLVLLGHSRGGGICIIKATEDKRVKGLVTWASVSVCKTPWGAWSFEKMEAWKKTGVAYYENKRTGQKLPMFYQLHEDYLANEKRLNIRNALSRLDIPILVCHGMADEAVPADHAHLLKSWSARAELFLVDSDHVFSRKHPWLSYQLPDGMQHVVNKTIEFIRAIC